MNRSSVLVAVALAAVLLGCPRRGAPPAAPTPTAPSELYPLAVGNTWTYVDRSAANAAPTRRTVRVVELDRDGYFVDDQRGALRADADCLHDRARRLLCAPIRAGHSWTSVVSASSVERYQIAGVGETVTVPAGTFRGCVRVRAQLRAGKVESIAEHTYAPGVGLVRLETFAVVDGTARPQVRGELETYRLAGR